MFYNEYVPRLQDNGSTFASRILHIAIFGKAFPVFTFHFRFGHKHPKFIPKEIAYPRRSIAIHVRSRESARPPKNIELSAAPNIKGGEMNLLPNMLLQVRSTPFHHQIEQSKPIHAKKAWRNCIRDVGQVEYIRWVLRQRRRRLRSKKFDQVQYRHTLGLRLLMPSNVNLGTLEDDLH